MWIGGYNIGLLKLIVRIPFIYNLIELILSLTISFGFLMFRYYYSSAGTDSVRPDSNVKLLAA